MPNSQVGGESFPSNILKCLLYLSTVHGSVLSHFSRVWLFATPWTVARQAPLSTGFSRQEYWSALPCCPPGDLPDPGIEPTSLMSALAGEFFTTSATWEAPPENHSLEMTNSFGFRAIPPRPTTPQVSTECFRTSLLVLFPQITRHWQNKQEHPQRAAFLGKAPLWMDQFGNHWYHCNTRACQSLKGVQDISGFHGTRFLSPHENFPFIYAVTPKVHSKRLTSWWTSGSERKGI